MKDKQQPGHDIIPGHPEYKPGVTGNKSQQPVEEKSFKKDKQPAGKKENKERKIVNEQEQDIIVNNQKSNKTNTPAK